MASSTEEVSVAQIDTPNDRTQDDTTTSEKQFAVLKNFDFLEYELESQGVSKVVYIFIYTNVMNNLIILFKSFSI